MALFQTCLHFCVCLPLSVFVSAPHSLSLHFFFPHLYSSFMSFHFFTLSPFSFIPHPTVFFQPFFTWLCNTFFPEIFACLWGQAATNATCCYYGNMKHFGCMGSAWLTRLTSGASDRLLSLLCENSSLMTTRSDFELWDAILSPNIYIYIWYKDKQFWHSGYLVVNKKCESQLWYFIYFHILKN